MTEKDNNDTYKEVQHALVMSKLTGKGVVYFRELPPRWHILSTKSVVGTRVAINKIIESRRVSTGDNMYLIFGVTQHLMTMPTSMSNLEPEKRWSSGLEDSETVHTVYDFSKIVWGVDQG